MGRALLVGFLMVLLFVVMVLTGYGLYMDSTKQKYVAVTPFIVASTETVMQQETPINNPTEQKVESPQVTHQIEDLPQPKNITLTQDQCDAQIKIAADRADDLQDQEDRDKTERDDARVNFEEARKDYDDSKSSGDTNAINIARNVYEDTRDDYDASKNEYEETRRERKQAEEELRILLEQCRNV